MRARDWGDNGLFRRALSGAPDLYHLLEIRKKIQLGTSSALHTAFELLESRDGEPTRAMKGQLARLYEQICRCSSETVLTEMCKERAVILYREAGQPHRAVYLEMLCQAQKCSW